MFSGLFWRKRSFQCLIKCYQYRYIYFKFAQECERHQLKSTVGTHFGIGSGVVLEERHLLSSRSELTSPSPRYSDTQYRYLSTNKLDINMAMSDPDKADDRTCIFHRDGDDETHFAFYYKGHPNSKSKLYTFKRPHDEPLSKTLWKFSNSIGKNVLSKKKYARGNSGKNTKITVGEARAINPDLDQLQQNEIDVQLFGEDGQPLDLALPNGKAWKLSKTLCIKYLSSESKYSVVLNAPSVTELQLPDVCLTGFPVLPGCCYPNAQFQFSTCEWFRLDREYVEKAKVTKNNHKLVPDFVDQMPKQYLQTSLPYVPCADDVGHYLLVRCRPRDAAGTLGLSSCAVMTQPVAPAPERTLHDVRMPPPLTPDRLRVVSYNVLAAMYTESDYARTELFPYCPSHALDRSYRMTLLTRELMDYDGDVVCLQEVQDVMYMGWLQTIMSKMGYRGHLQSKYGSAREGCAVLYKEHKFNLLEQYGVELRERVKEARHADIAACLASNLHMQAEMEERTTAANVVVLERRDSPGTCLCVLTTHLYFSPFASVIRLLQTIVCVRVLEETCTKWTEKGYDVSTLLCGDLNSGHENGVYKLITEGAISRTHADWSRTGPRTHGGVDYTPVQGFDADHSLSLASAYGTPAFTNFTEGYQGCLDYIFYDSLSLDVEHVVPVPSEAEMNEFGYMPNEYAPSDHLPLIADLSFKSNSIG